MEEEKKVSEETKVKMPNPNPYKKDRGKDDAEVEAFAKGELAKFQREQKEKEATAATEQKDTDASEETAEKSEVKATPIAERPAKAEDRVFKKRYDDLKKHYDSTINKHKEELQSLRTQLESSTKQFVPPKSKEELEEWRRDYPDMYDSVMQMTTEATMKAKQEMEEELLQIKKQQTSLARDRAEVELAKKHPDFKDIRDSADFHEWASVQDSTVQSWLYDNTDNPNAAARAIDLYKYDRGLSTKKVNYDAKKEAAKAVSKTKVSETPSEKKTWKWTEIQKMKPDVYAKFEEEIDKAHREGRIV